MHCRLLLFAQLVEVAGAESLDLELDPGATVASLWPALVAQHPAPAERLAPWRDRAAVAVNRRYAPRSALLNDGDEIALVPPISGG